MSFGIESYGRAAAAYAKAARGEAPSRPDAGSEPSFAALAKDAMDGAIASANASEKASVEAVGQGADLNHVVTAVAEAEVTLQSVIAVRERIIEAYKDIMRMPI